MKTAQTINFKLCTQKNRGHGFASLLVSYISVKKIIEKCNSVGADAHKVGKVVSFWPNFDPNFADIWRG